MNLNLHFGYPLKIYLGPRATIRDNIVRYFLLRMLQLLPLDPRV